MASHRLAPDSVASAENSMERSVAIASSATNPSPSQSKILTAGPASKTTVRMSTDEILALTRVVGIIPSALLKILGSAGTLGLEAKVLGGLPGNSDFLEGLAKDLKKTLGTGGSVVGATIELQGEWRERLRVLLPSKNLSVKG